MGSKTGLTVEDGNCFESCRARWDIETLNADCGKCVENVSGRHYYETRDLVFE
jgi:hypothetical protein